MVRKLMIFMIICLAIFIGVLLLYSWYTKGETEFDRTVWTDEARIYSAENPRVAMVHDVMSRLQSGMSRADVVELLGEPTETSYFSEWDMVYWLGLEESSRSAMGFGIDSQWLGIRFVDNKLDTVQVVTD